MDDKPFVVYSLEFTLSSQPVERVDDCWSAHVGFGWKHRCRGEWFSIVCCLDPEYVLMFVWQLPGPIMADIRRADKWGRSFALSTFAPFLGAAIGPILGGFISQGIG